MKRFSRSCAKRRQPPELVWFSLLIAVAAFAALWRFKAGIIPVIGACAVAGLAYSLLP